MMVTNFDEKLVTVREAAAKCGSNAETIRRWIWSGKLPAEKMGNKFYIKQSDLDIACGKNHESKPDEDWVNRATALREKMRARGVKPIDSGEFIRQMREERMNEL
jgi:excisionase family DNA binding protein